MFEDLNIRTGTTDEGYHYVYLMDLVWHLMGATQGLFNEANAMTLESENLDHAYYFQGQVDALREVTRLLAEGGLALEFANELETL